MKPLTGIKGRLSRGVPAGSSRAEQGSRLLEHLARPATLYCNDTINRDIQVVFYVMTEHGTRAASTTCGVESPFVASK
ncbi:hypothetical protein Hypma_002174 [Hypsizygus marmoreus]|uniref:Uncharacterized protein n=1 Tax=Hypsizygus marmoreus TaxID=39966 RepID=A0A369K7N1_HYPMA|nr:hypothetical protein Hypma_002174 [Hypsizygus marmoreus]